MGDGQAYAPNEAGRTRGVTLALGAILLLAAALRLAKLPGMVLGYDELQSATHAVRAFPVNVLSVVLHDPHPPFYYLLLSEWLRFGTGDAFVVGLSVLIGLLLVWATFWVGRAHFGARVGLVAAFACAVSPLALYWSHHARMYALVMLLALWAWHANRRWLARAARRDAFAIVVSELLLVYSHMAAPFFLAVVWVEPLLGRLGDRRALVRWGVLHVPVVLLALPALYFPLGGPPGHMQSPDLAELARTLALLVDGLHPGSPEWIGAGAAAFGIVGVCLLARAPTRAFGFAFFVLPFAVAGAVSHGFRPVWYASRLFAFLVPFVALGLARLAAGPGVGRATRALAALVLALSLAGTADYMLRFEKPRGFLEAALIVKERGQPGDLVLVPSIKDKWAFNWYFEGPGWSRAVWTEGAAAAIRSALHRDERRELLQRIGGYGREPGDGEIRVLPASDNDLDVVSSAPRVWVLARGASDRDALLAQYEVGERNGVFPLQGMELSLYGQAGRRGGRHASP